MVNPSWSPERTTALREMYQAPDLQREEIRARINCMPGHHITLNALKIKVSSMRLRRPAGYVPDCTRKDMLWRDPRRVEIVREQWLAGIPRIAIVDAVNAIPGPIVSAVMVKNKAGDMGLRRPPHSPKPCGTVIVRTDAWTPARNAKLREMAADSRSRSQVLHTLNGMDGVQITQSMLRRKLERSGLKLAPELRLPRPRVVPPQPPVVVVERALPMEPMNLAPSADGLVYAPFHHVRGWCRAKGFDCDGSDMDRVNKVRSYYGVAPFVIDWTGGGQSYAAR